MPVHTGQRQVACECRAVTLTRHVAPGFVYRAGQRSRGIKRVGRWHQASVGPVVRTGSGRRAPGRPHDAGLILDERGRGRGRRCRDGVSESGLAERERTGWGQIKIDSHLME